MQRRMDGTRTPWQPVSNNGVYLLDESMRPVQEETPGEIYIGRLSLARGYMGQPALTASKFVSDPFSPQPGSRMYRTGDLAQGRPETLSILGRRDHQLKIRGFRIELGEVEATLNSDPQIHSAAEPRLTSLTHAAEVGMD